MNAKYITVIMRIAPERVNAAYKIYRPRFSGLVSSILMYSMSGVSVGSFCVAFGVQNGVLQGVISGVSHGVSAAVLKGVLGVGVGVRARTLEIRTNRLKRIIRKVKKKALNAFRGRN